MPQYTMADFRAELARRRGRSPRLVERRTSSYEFFKDLVRRAKARIRELRKLEPHHVMRCPWAVAIGGECWKPCPCGGTGTVTVAFMLEHYARVVFDYRGLTNRNPHHAVRKVAGTCINGLDHPLPAINPITGKPYTRCEPCRATHRSSS